jgi:hypothetical protein
MSDTIWKMQMPTVAERLTKDILRINPRDPDYGKQVLAVITGALQAQDEIIARYREALVNGEDQ